MIISQYVKPSAADKMLRGKSNHRAVRKNGVNQDMRDRTVSVICPTAGFQISSRPEPNGRNCGAFCSRLNSSTSIITSLSIASGPRSAR